MNYELIWDAQALGVELDVDLHASRKVETHEGVDGLGGGIEDVDEALDKVVDEPVEGEAVLMNETFENETFEDEVPGNEALEDEISGEEITGEEDLLPEDE